jgi:AraC family transcriptional regulator of adaptative response / DNA-3-methyladenine glycosylase II
MPSTHGAAAAAIALDPELCSRACDARDSRFDGVFLVAITTTRIYCRPVCPARVSHPDRRRFYPSAAAAEAAGFRPCLRCRPELAPGRATMDALPRLAAAAARRVAEGAMNGGSVADLARELGVGERHLRRAFARELGISPVQLALTHRLLLAKRLLSDTRLPVTQIAYASGFQSLRRFNAVFLARYRMPPTALRRPERRSPVAEHEAPAELLRLTLGYRAPLAWDTLVSCLARDLIAGVEVIDGRRYGRTVSIDGHSGIILVEDSRSRHDAALPERSPGSAHLDVDVSLSLVPVLMPLLARLRHLFDLDAEPSTVDAHLSREGLGPLVSRRPGIRLPGALDGFEAALRTMLGGWPADARLRDSTVARRVATSLGAPLESTMPTLDRLLPTPRSVADAGAARLVELGVPPERATPLVTLAERMSAGRLRLASKDDPMELVRALLSIDGIDERLATTIVMRAISWPDALSANAGALRPIRSAARGGDLFTQSERWRPWSAYAAMQLWAARHGRAAAR